MTTANNATGNESKGTKATKPLPNLLHQNMLEKGIEKYTKTVFLRALKEAGEGLLHVREADVVIMQKQQGNAALLHKLARECVKLTKEGDTVDLSKAASLMEDACKYNEEVFLSDYRKKNPDNLKDEDLQKITLRELAPSWNTLRTAAVKTLKTGEIDPSDYKNYSAMQAAYKIWNKKQTEEPESEGGERGAGGAVSSGKAAKSKGTAHRNALTDSAKSMIDNIMVALQDCDEKQQAKAVTILTKALGEIRHMIGQPDEDKASGVKTTKIHKPVADPADVAA